MPAPARPVKNTKPATESAAKSAAPAKAVKKESKPAAAPKAAEPVAPVATEPAAENVVTTADTIAALEQDFANAIAAMARISADMAKLKTDLRAYHSRAVREVKAASKAKGRRTKAKTGDRPASGFVKPTLISNELAAFLGVKAGTEMARTEVTKALHAYIQSHQLKNKDNGRIIEADGALSKLLKLQKGEELTYFNLQKYMTPHFAKHTATA
jgi:chromatin remodeling complex protein RSC6